MKIIAKIKSVVAKYSVNWKCKKCGCSLNKKELPAEFLANATQPWTGFEKCKMCSTKHEVKVYPSGTVRTKVYNND